MFSSSHGRSARSLAFSLFLFGSLGRPSAQPNCTLLDTDYKLVTLAVRNGANALEEPLKMALDLDGAGNVDIYFVERKGKVRKYFGATKEVKTLGTLTVNSEFEGGLTGIALDPGFKTSRWLYVYYGHGTGTAFRFRVARFTLNGAGELDMASEKVVLAIPATPAALHTGGAMAFDKAGNLYITVGDNAAGETGPGNTNDLRGKILRIKPTPEGTYTVPAGNLFPVLPGGQSGSAQTRPEIYVMGTRNAYTLTHDPKLDLITWGDVGPDQGMDTEEHNTAAKAGNYGYPYYAGNQIELIGGGTPAKPVNNHAGNTGLKTLPAAVAATHAYKQSAAVTGPVYRYPSAPSNIKFPTQFEGKWFVADFTSGFVDTVTLDATGTRMLSVWRVFKNIRLDRPLDIQQGPDGALYVINYSGWFSATATTALARIEYRGCPVGIGGRSRGLSGASLRVRGFAVEVAGEGAHTLEVVDLRGKVIASLVGAGARQHDIRSVVGGRAGLYLVRVISGSGRMSRVAVVGK